jgi:hypothetical protein
MTGILLSTYLANRKHRRPKTSIYKGVSWAQKYQFWRVQRSYNGKICWIGCFKSQFEAAKAHDVHVFLYGKGIYNLGEPTQEEIERYATSVSKTHIKKSQYRGVTWQSRTASWNVYHRVGGKRIYVGISKDETTAAKMHDVSVFLYGGHTPYNFGIPTEAEIYKGVSWGPKNTT